MLSNYKTKTEPFPIVKICIIRYKVMSFSFNTRAMRSIHKGETIIFQTNLHRYHLSVFRPISRNWYLYPRIRCCKCNSVQKIENT